MIEFNLNNYVNVKLTEEGIKILKQLNKDVLEQYTDLKDDSCLKNLYLPKIDENGYCRYQMWEVMNLFGKYLYNGCTTLPIEQTILLDIPQNT